MRLEQLGILGFDTQRMDRNAGIVVAQFVDELAITARNRKHRNARWRQQSTGGTGFVVVDQHGNRALGLALRRLVGKQSATGSAGVHLSAANRETDIAGNGERHLIGRVCKAGEDVVTLDRFRDVHCQIGFARKHRRNEAVDEQAGTIGIEHLNSVGAFAGVGIGADTDHEFTSRRGADCAFTRAGVTRGADHDGAQARGIVCRDGGG